MIRTLTIAAAVLAPTSAFAHNDGHVQMSLISELSHMLSDPPHLGLIAVVAGVAALTYKGLRSRSETAKQHD